MAWKWERVTGAPVRVGEYTIRPEARALSVGWGEWGGVVWNRPIRIHWQRRDETGVLPVIDLTRVAQLTGLAILCLIGSLWWLARQR